jgi:hypothetical protein
MTEYKGAEILTAAILQDRNFYCEIVARFKKSAEFIDRMNRLAPDDVVACAPQKR